MNLTVAIYVFRPIDWKWNCENSLDSSLSHTFKFHHRQQTRHQIYNITSTRSLANKNLTS